MYKYYITTSDFDFDYVIGPDFNTACFNGGYNPWEVQCIGSEPIGS